jgi:hypothetical protein
MNTVIEKGLQMPKFSHGNSKYPFNEMEVGDSIKMPDTSDEKTFRSTVGAANARFKVKGKELRVSKVNGEIRVWRTK